jgi:HEAT repeat protein
LGGTSEATRLALDEALSDGEASVRQNAAWSLTKFAEKALPSLHKALRDKDSLVTRDAASALLMVTKNSELVHPMVKDLLPLCRDPNSEVRRAALNVLARVVDHRDKEAIEPLCWALEQPDKENKRNAALALANIGGPATLPALPILLEAIKNGDPKLRREATLGIRNIGEAAKEAVPELVRLLREDQDPDIRRNAAVSLGGIGKLAEAAIPLLVEKIQDPKEKSETRVKCCMTLARIGPVPAAEQFIPSLVQVLGDTQQDAEVREKVIWALRIHGTRKLNGMNNIKETFTRILQEPANDANRMLRYDSAYMLGVVWQRQAPDATLDVLTEFLEDGTIELFLDEVVNVGTTSNEGKSETGKVKLRGKGDGRNMAVEALKMIGAARYRQRPAIMKQLTNLAQTSTDVLLKKKSAELVQMAEGSIL